MMLLNIQSRSHVNMTVDSREFGDMFAHMAADDQVAVLREMVASMSDHKLQWDYIAIELELPENADLMTELRSIFGGMFAEHDAAREAGL